MYFRLAIAAALLLGLPTAAWAEEVYGGRRHSIDLGEYQGFVLEPTTPGAEGSRPWLWYAPVLGRNPSPNIEWIARQLIADGFYIAGVNVGESMGNPAGRAGFARFYQQVVSQFKLEPKARLLAQSRGGLMLYNWAAENPEKVQCIVGIYPVCDLRSYPKLKRAAEAYGMTIDELQLHLAEHNPVDRLEPLARQRVPILHIHGDSDTLVPLAENSQAVYNRYRSLGGDMELIIVPGIGHKAVPEFFQEPRLVAFLKAGGLVKNSAKP